MLRDDTMQWMSGYPPSQLPDATAVHHAAQLAYEATPFQKRGNDAIRAMLKAQGAVPPVEELPSFQNAFGVLWDRLLQLGVLEFEFPRSDLRPNIDYLGHPKTIGTALGAAKLPEFWDEVLSARKAGKRIVVIT